MSEYLNYYVPNWVKNMYDEEKAKFEEITPESFISKDLGYPFEEHSYTTDDGYVNSIFRVPGAKGFDT